MPKVEGPQVTSATDFPEGNSQMSIRLSLVGYANTDVIFSDLNSIEFISVSSFEFSSPESATSMHGGVQGSKVLELRVHNQTTKSCTALQELRVHNQATKSCIASAKKEQKSQRVAIKALFISIALISLAIIALLSYLIFYMVYIPKLVHSYPVYLQYHKNNSPYAIVDFTNNGLYDSILTEDQSYIVSVDLNVPCILAYQSTPLRIFTTIWQMLPLLFGFSKEEQNLHVVMLENMVESSEAPITHAIITISNENLEVYIAKIRLDAYFQGLRSFVSWQHNNGAENIVAKISKNKENVDLSNSVLDQNQEIRFEEDNDSNNNIRDDKWLEVRYNDKTIDSKIADSESENESLPPGLNVNLQVNNDSLFETDEDEHSIVSRLSLDEESETAESTGNKTDGSATPTNIFIQKNTPTRLSTTHDDSEEGGGASTSGSTTSAT
nr:14209_t:CDS:10 [Entrophospora candida]